MKNDIRIANTSYLNFDSEKKFSTPLFKKILSNSKIRRKTIFINSGVGYEDKLVEKIVNAAGKSGYEVYLTEQREHKYDNVTYVTLNSKDYFEAMLTSELIYTNCFIHHNYIHRKNQILVFNKRFMNSDDLDDRAAISSIESRMDWLVSDDKGKKSLSESELIDLIMKDSLKANGDSINSKEKVLFLVNMNSFKTMYAAFLSISRKINYDKYDVSIFILGKYKEEYENFLSKIDKRINIIIRKGGLLCDKETARRMEYLKSVDNYISDVGELNGFINTNIFEDEKKRIFGDVSYDIIFNMKFDAIYWKILISRMSGKKIYFDVNKYEKLEKKELKCKKEYVNSYDKVIYMHKDSLVKNASKSEIRSGKKGLLPDLEYCVGIEDRPFEKRQDESGSEWIVIPMRKEYPLDRYQLRVMKLTDNRYLITSPSMTVSEIRDKIAKLGIDAGEQIIIFDNLNLIYKSDLEGVVDMEMLYIFREPGFYAGLKPYLQKRINIKDENIYDDKADIIKWFI